MIYLFNLNNLVFNKPANKISLKIFKFNIILLNFIFSISIFYLICLIIFLIFFRNKIKNNNFIHWGIKKKINICNLIIIIFLIFYSTNLLIKIKKKNSPYITVKIVGYQWKWYYNYINGLGKNINYFSTVIINFYEILNIISKNKNYIQNVDNKLILPVNKNIRLIFSSNDVIHSWFVPSLSIKQDAIPGFYRDFYFKSNKLGVYKGFCTELCGKYHSYMPISLNLISLINYKKWIISFSYIKFFNFNY